MKTGSKAVSPKLTPLPSAAGDDLRDMIFAPSAEDEAPPPPPPAPTPMAELMRAVATPAPAPVPDMPVLEESEQADVRRAILTEIAAEESRQPLPAVFQDYSVRCRMRGVEPGMDLAAFRSALALARAGIVDADGWDEALTLAASLPEEMLTPFLGIARAARANQPCPSDAQIAALYGTSSLGRARRMLAHIEEKGLIVARTDLSGKRSVSLPHLGWTTAPAWPDPTKPQPVGRTVVRAAERSRLL